MNGSRVLLIGAGGLGSPAARVLAQSGIGHLTIVDDDRVAADNLHRQTLYTDAHVGERKAEVAAQVLKAVAAEHGHTLSTTTVVGRFLPDNALALAAEHDLLVEGADNFATKFLAADAARIAGRPVVQAGAVRWQGWALRAGRRGPCLRCVFEDIPRDRVETCAEAGVVGPVVGVLGALQAALALRCLADAQAPAELWHYRALDGILRRVQVRAREDCRLCSGAIRDLRAERYLASCAA